MRLAVLVVLAAVRAATAAPIHPAFGDLPTRTSYHLEAAATAPPREAAWHYAAVCYWHATAAFDPELRTEPCPRAARLAADHRLVEVEAALDLARASVYAGLIDPRSIGMLQAIIDREREADATTLAIRPYARASLMLGIIHSLLGSYTASQQAFAHARELGTSSSDLETIAWVDTWACAAATFSGQLATGRDDCDRAQTYVDLTGDVMMEMQLAYWQAELADASGEPDAALAGYERSLARARTAPHDVRGHLAEMMRIAPLVKLHRIDEAARIAADVEAGIASGRIRANAEIFDGLAGRLAFARGDYASAARREELAAQSPQHIVRIGALGRLAAARARLGDRAATRAALERAIGEIEADRASLAGGDRRAAFLDRFGNPYAALAVALAHDGDARRALEIAEAGRARSLLDAVHDATAAGATAPTLSATKIQALLAADELLIEYVVTPEGAIALVASTTAITAVPLPGAGARDELDARISFFQQLVQEADEATLLPAAAALHRDLLAPALALAPAGVRTLVISADGPLHALPFDALYGADGFVVDHWRLVQVPSISALVRAPAGSRGQGVLIVADPQTALAALPGARDEADRIARRLFGPVVFAGASAAKEQLVGAGIDRYAVLHFATHAIADQLAPQRSALLLGASAESDGRWTIDEIYRQRLAADLVVLAGCETGGGAQWSGEGVMSLARAFLYAGARATIATRWNLDDTIGPEFAAELYDLLTSGEALGEAATRAKRKLRARGAPPRGWAGYVVTGAPRNPVPIIGSAVVDDDRRARISLVVLVVLVGGLACAAAGALRRWPGRALAAAAAVACLVTDLPTSTPAASGAIPQRGAAHGLAVAEVGGTITWSPPPRGTPRTRFFDADGRLISQTSAASPVAVPPASRGWQVEIRDRGVVIAGAVGVRR